MSCGACGAEAACSGLRLRKYESQRSTDDPSGDLEQGTDHAAREVREALHVEEGDDVAFVVELGQVTTRGLKSIAGGPTGCHRSGAAYK